MLNKKLEFFFQVLKSDAKVDATIIFAVTINSKPTVVLSKSKAGDLEDRPGVMEATLDLTRINPETADDFHVRC
jgi:hypothetical protein